MNERTFKNWYQSANRASGGRLEILKQAIESFNQTRGAQAAASMAYYAILSIFPLLLVIIAGGSYFLDSQTVYQEVSGWMRENIPVSTQLINQNIREVLDTRGTVGVIGLLTLAWSASGVFTGLAYNINLAWPGANRRNFLEKRLVGFAMIGGLSLLFLLSLSLGSLPALLQLAIPGDGPADTLVGWQVLSHAGAWLTTFILFLAIYRWVPTVDVPWKASIWTAALITLGFEGALSGFRFSLSNGFQNYELVYGSLGTIVALLFLIYLIALITLFGAHLCAAISDSLSESEINIKEKEISHPWTSSNTTT